MSVLVGLIVNGRRSSARSGTRARETARAFIIIAGRTEVRAARLLLAHITHVRTRMRRIHQRMGMLVSLVINRRSRTASSRASTREAGGTFIIVARTAEIGHRGAISTYIADVW